MKKKYGSFKVLLFLLLMVVVATYFIKGRGDSVQYLALVDVFFDFVQSFYYFFDTLIFVLVVGGFYGFLNRVPAYKQLVKTTADKVGKRGKLFLIIVAVVLALLSSLTGLNFLMLLFIPFFVTVILLLGYDKLVALSVTVGSVLIGLLGGVFVTFKDSSSQYATSFSSFEKMVGLKDNWSLATTLPKCLLLVVGVGLLIYHVVSYLKNVEGKKYKLTKSDPFYVELKDKNGKKIEESTESKVHVWPLLLCFGILVVLLVLGYLPWSDLFGIDCFNKFHTWLTGLTIGKYAVFTSLISSTLTGFGTWGGLGNYLVAIFLVCFVSVILSLIYRIKFDNAMEGFIYGIKKMIYPAILIMLAYTVLVTSYNNGFIETIITAAGKSFGDNVIIHSLVALLGSVLNVDLYYTVAGVFSTTVSSLSDKANLSVFAVMFQSVYGVVQIVGPTSLLLLVGLSYLEVPYSSWLKYIWRFIVELLIAIFVVLMIVSLL